MNPTPSPTRLAASRAAIRQQLQARAAEPPLLDRVAREHPFALLAGAALGGAALVALRPWRWLPRPPVLASLLWQLAWQALAARRHADQGLRGVHPVSAALSRGSGCSPARQRERS